MNFNTDKSKFIKLLIVSYILAGSTPFLVDHLEGDNAISFFYNRLLSATIISIIPIYSLSLNIVNSSKPILLKVLLIPVFVIIFIGYTKT